MREVDLVIVIGQHMRQSDGSHCTTACTTIKCNGPRLVQPLVSTVCKAPLPSAACEHMRRSCCPRRVESEVFMRECMCSCSRTYLGHQASPANTKGVSPRSVRPPSSLRRCCTALVPAQTEGTHSSSAVQAFRTGSSTGTAGDLSAVPAAIAGCVP